jgi:tetratricopeptide (TPR) repeat protein
VPLRTREHALEKESRLAFEVLLPERWVYRRKDDDDYGIDGEVEVFRDDGVGIGLTFLVQLKATDEKSPDKGLARSVPLDRASYYRSLALPVLMVRYLAAHEQTYVRWFHLQMAFGRARGRKSTTFRWTSEDLWDEGRGWRLADEAQTFLELRSAAMRLPMPLRLDIEPAETWSAGEGEIALSVMELLERTPDVLAQTDGLPSAATASMRIRPQRVSVELGGVTGATVELGSGYEPGPGGEQLARDGLVAAALAFESIGQAGTASRLATAYLPGSTLVRHDDVVWALAASLSRARLVRESLDLSDTLDTMDTTSVEASLPFTFPAIAHAAALTEPELERYREVMRARITRREAAGRRQGAALECFNLGNHHRVRGEPHQALELYDRAAGLDPSYEEYPHYWRERANVLFFAARLDEQAHAYDGETTEFRRLFEEAIDAYERAVAMGDDPWDQALLADTLLHAGRYEEAEAAFAAYLGSSERQLELADGEWYLKTLVLPEIVERRGYRRQERRLREAEHLAGSPTGDDSPAERRALSERAFELDALSPLAWFNLGIALHEEGQVDEAATAFLAAGLFSYFDVEAWSNVFMHHAFSGELDLLPVLLATGQMLTRRQLVPALRDLARRQDPKFPREQFLQALADQVAALADSRADTFELRQLEGGGRVRGIELPTATHRERPAEPLNVRGAGRNDPCPCGSGRKYKRCHGR